MAHPRWEYVGGYPPVDYAPPPPPPHRGYYAPAGHPVVVAPQRPRSFARRMVSDDYFGGPVYPHHGGALIVPGMGEPLRRSHSVGNRPPPVSPPIVINNIQEDLHRRGRPVALSPDDFDWSRSSSSVSPKRGRREHSRRHSRAHSRDRSHSGEHSPYRVWQHDVENETLRKELNKLKREKEREEEEERLRKELIAEIALKEKKQREEEEKRKELEKKVIEDFKRREVERKAAEEKREAAEEQKYRDRLKRDLGLNETQIAKIVKKDKDNAVDLRQAVVTKIARKHVSIETLKVYGLPFSYDEADPDRYVLIKRWVPEYEQELLWDHTRRLREERSDRVRLIELKELKKQRERKLSLARKRTKSPGLFDFIGGSRK